MGGWWEGVSMLVWCMHSALTKALNSWCFVIDTSCSDPARRHGGTLQRRVGRTLHVWLLQARTCVICLQERSRCFTGVLKVERNIWNHFRITQETCLRISQSAFQQWLMKLYSLSRAWEYGWCVRARPAVLDLQSLSVLAVRSEEMSVVVFAGTGVRVCCRACTRAGAWEGMKVRFWTETFDVKEQRLQSVCQLPALYHHPNTWPLQKKEKKKCAFGVVCACWCARVHMALRACICVSGLITQRLGFVTLGYCEHSCAHPVMCHGLMEKERQSA